MLLQRHVDRWLFEEYRADAQSLGLYRVLFGSYVLLAVVPMDLWIRDLPQASFSPPVSLAALFLSYPPPSLVVALNAFTMLSACALIIGWHTVASSLGTAIGICALASFEYADGKIDHTVLMVLTPLTLAWSGWGATFSVDEHRDRSKGRMPMVHQPWLMALLSMLIGMALLTGAMGKIHGGWLRPESRPTKWHLLSNYRFVGRQTVLGAWALSSLPNWAWKSMDYVTVLWEAGFILTVPRRTACRVACAFGAFFHLGVWLLFDIAFAVNPIAYGAFVSWACIRPSAITSLQRWLLALSRAQKLLLCAIPFAIALGSLIMLGSDSRTTLALSVENCVLGAAVVVAMAYLVQLMRPRMVRTRPA